MYAYIYLITKLVRSDYIPFVKTSKFIQSFKLLFSEYLLPKGSSYFGMSLTSKSWFSFIRWVTISHVHIFNFTWDLLFEKLIFMFVVVYQIYNFLCKSQSTKYTIHLRSHVIRFVIYGIPYWYGNSYTFWILRDTVPLITFITFETSCLFVHLDHLRFSIYCISTYILVFIDDLV